MSTSKKFSQPTSPNTAYATHFVRPSFGVAETSYMLGTLSTYADKSSEVQF